MVHGDADADADDSDDDGDGDDSDDDGDGDDSDDDSDDDGDGDDSDDDDDDDDDSDDDDDDADVDVDDESADRFLPNQALVASGESCGARSGQTCAGHQKTTQKLSHLLAPKGDMYVWAWQVNYMVASWTLSHQ